MTMTIYNREQRTRFKALTANLNMAAADTPTTVGVSLLAGRAKYTIYVTYLAVIVRTVAAQALTFQDDNGTPKEIAELVASATKGLHVLIDDPDGVPLTEGKDLDMTGAAGVEATVMVRGYLKPTGTMVPSDI